MQISTRLLLLLLEELFLPITLHVSKMYSYRVEEEEQIFQSSSSFAGLVFFGKAKLEVVVHTKISPEQQLPV